MLNLHLFLFNCFSFPAAIITFVLHRNLFKFFYSSHKVTNLIHLTVVLLQWMKTTTTKQPFKFIEKCKLHSNHQFIFSSQIDWWPSGVCCLCSFLCSRSFLVRTELYLFSPCPETCASAHAHVNTRAKSPAQTKHHPW